MKTSKPRRGWWPMPKTSTVWNFCATTVRQADVYKRQELGDVAWYLAETATALDIGLDEVLERNIEKLKNRYPEGFSAEKSQHRQAGDV